MGGAWCRALQHHLVDSLKRIVVERRHERRCFHRYCAVRLRRNADYPLTSIERRLDHAADLSLRDGGALSHVARILGAEPACPALDRSK